MTELETRLQAALQEVTVQRNSAFDRCAALAADIAALRLLAQKQEPEAKAEPPPAESD